MRRFSRLVVLVGLVTTGLCAQTVRIHHVDVGQGSATLVVAPNGQACLIDAGTFGQGNSDIVPLLQAEGATLHSIILTHFHTDHWGGIPEVLAAGFVPPVVYDRGPSNQPGTIGSYLSAVSGLRSTMVPGTVVNFGGVILECVAANGQVLGGPTVSLGGTNQQENARSIALRLTFGDYQEAIAGDLTGGGSWTADVETPTAPVMGDVDTMVLNHHGSSTSNNNTWIGLLAGETVVCSTAQNSPFGHPHLEVVNAVVQAPSTVEFYRLNQGSPHPGGVTVNGTLLIETDGSSYTISGGSVAPVTLPVDGGGNPSPMTQLIPGDVVVSEYMQNPAAVFDSDGEWLELFNTTASDINLQGFVIRDQDNDSFVVPTLTLPSRGYVTLCNNGNSAENGGVTADFVWPSGSFFLSNGSDEIEVVAPGGVVLDAIVYDNGATFPDPNGRSVERLDLTAGVVAFNFGEATTAFGQGDLGTPGTTNSLDTTGPFTTLGIGGVPNPGATLTLTVNGGFAGANKAFFLGASSCPVPGVPLPGTARTIDLCLDALLSFSLTPGNGVFNGFSGSMNFFGVATATVTLPAFTVPGVDVYLSGVVIDLSAPDGISSIIDNARFTTN